jgi:hypothetical protein
MTKHGFIKLNLEQVSNKFHGEVTIHVYTGGISSNLSFSFNSALQSAISEWSSDLLIKSKSMTILNLRESGWSEKEFIGWLLESDIHMIVSHPHQGTETFGWDVSILYNEFGRLYDHIGFPSGEQLMCPIFTQHKYGYLEPMRTFKMTNPTLRISVHKNFESYFHEWAVYYR